MEIFINIVYHSFMKKWSLYLWLFNSFLFSSNSVLSKENSSFNLHITHSESKRLYQNEVVPIETRLSSLTVYKSERLSQRVSGSLILGVQEQIQDKNIILAARYASGYFGGVSFNYDLIRTDNYRFNLFTQYLYHELEGVEGEQRVKTSWYDASVGIGNYYNLTKRLQILADVSFVSVKGSQRALEPISQTINFKNETNILYGVGMAYHVNASGHLVVKWIGGASQGFRLFLAKDF